MINLLNDYSFQNDINQRIAHEFCECIKKYLPVPTYQIVHLCKLYHINFRCDFTRGGQDNDRGRLNVKTDGKGNVVNLNLG